MGIYDTFLAGGGRGRVQLPPDAEHPGLYGQGQRRGQFAVNPNAGVNRQGEAREIDEENWG